MSKKRILITGSNGFLARKLIAVLNRQQVYDLYATSASENRNPDVQASTFSQLDLTDLLATQQLIDQLRPDILINTAAISSVDQCESNPQACMALNTQAVAHLAHIAAERDIHLIQLSTDFVFDGLHGPYRETDAVNPINQYGLSKVKAEQEIQHAGCKAAILRTILVYGNSADPNRSNLVLGVKAALEAKKIIKIVENQWRMPTFVDDLAQACLLAIEQQAQGIFHISGNQLYSIYEIAQQVANYWNLDATYIQPIRAESLPGAHLRPERTGFFIQKAEKELGFKPISLSESFNIMDRNINN